MDMLSVSEVAERWGVSGRTVRHYCAKGRVPGAQRIGGVWLVPSDAQKPARQQRVDAHQPDLLDVLRRERKAGMPGGIYHHVQIELTYNSNHMEGSRLTHEQTRYIFETNTIGFQDVIKVDDIVEAANHFRCIDTVIDIAHRRLSEDAIKRLHAQLKNGTSDAGHRWFAVGDYKRLPNEVGGMPTAAPEDVAEDMRSLIDAYEAHAAHTVEDIIAFHVAFERIHPFQDGNGRVGRLVMFKECLRCGIVPFIITDELKMFYYRGLREWDREQGYLIDTCLTAQDEFRAVLERFRLPIA